MPLRDEIKREIMNSLSKIPLGCEGRIISFDSTANTAVVEVYDDSSGKRIRYNGVDTIAQATTVLSAFGKTYSPGDYVYVGWLGGQKTHPIIIGHLRAQIGSWSSLFGTTTQDKSGTTSGSETTTTNESKTATDESYDNNGRPKTDTGSSGATR